MENKPLVSILLPSYNHEHYIDDTMKSLIGQSYENIEILIVDDCSCDRTFEKILYWKQRLEKRFSSVFIMRNNRNLGVTESLNKMLVICKGKYIKTIASDDFLFDDSIEKLVDYYEQHQEMGLIFANGIRGNKDTHYPLKNKSDFPVYYKVTPDLSGDLVRKLYMDNFILAPGAMFSRNTYLKIGKFDENIWIEDWDYYLRIAKEMPIGYLNELVVMYRYIDTSMTQSTSLVSRIRMRKSELQILEKFKENVNEELSRQLITDRCNKIFKEAFDMRSRGYVDEILSYMKKNRVALRGNNVFWRIIYKSHLVDGYFGK